MKAESIRQHLKPYGIVQRRRTTINHAFAAAIAPCDSYDPAVVARALVSLGQGHEEELKCVYCDAPAQTWDHILATVKKSEFSGAGHRVANLVPCCKPCNSEKGNKSWVLFVTQKEKNSRLRKKRVQRIEAHVSAMTPDVVPTDDPNYAELLRIKSQVFELLQRADVLAEKIRAKTKKS